MKISGKRIVITGGTSGIGLEIVKQLHSCNEVIVLSRSSPKLHATTKDLDGLVTYQVDLANLKEVETIADAIIKRFESIDILINNAASQYTRPRRCT